MTNPSHSNPNPARPAAHDHESAPEQAAISPRLAIAGVFVVLLVAVVLATIGILSRMHSERVLAQTTNQLAPRTVLALPPRPGVSTTELVLPGNVTAFTDAPIYARTSGYLLHWYYDIGARVKKGALLAVIDAPEVDQQLHQAQADLATAQATANNARIQADRYSGLVKTHAVSREDTDTYVNQAAATAAAVKSAQANVDRLSQLVAFEKIYAPFDGVVTARNIDIGQLIDAGAAKELFHLQAIQTLRVYTNIPQQYAGTAKIGSKINLTFPEHPGQTFQGTLVRTADAIDPASRTLLVEVDVDNRDGKLLPGSLAQVHFKTPGAAPTFIVPAAALIFRSEGLQLGTVVHGDTAHLVHVVIGEDDGANVQIISGLSANDLVIQDPPDSLIEGEKVAPQHPNGGR